MIPDDGDMSTITAALAGTSDLPWLAIAAATLASYVLGALWFTPLFGRAWDRSIGHVPDGPRRFALAYYLVPLVSSAAVSVALAVVLMLSRVGDLVAAVAVGAIVGLALAAVSVNNALTPHTPHPFAHGAIVGGYHLTSTVLIAVVLGLLG